MKISRRVLALSLCLSITLSSLQAYYDWNDASLCAAVISQNLDEVKAKIAFGISPNSQMPNGLNALHFAILNQSSEIIQHLIDSGADLNSITHYNYEGMTPLILAMKLRDFNTIKLLLNSGADLSDTSLIHYATIYEIGDLAIHLIHIQNNLYGMLDNGNTTLHTAAYVDNYEIASWLVENGMNLDMQNEDGESPLHIAAQHNSQAIINLLIEFGADINIQNNFGETPLFQATAENITGSSILLLQLGADPLLKDFYNLSVLGEAIDNESCEIITALFQSGINVNDQDENGDTILHLAIQYDASSEFIDFLLQSGADITIKNNYGQTPFQQ